MSGARLGVGAEQGSRSSSALSAGERIDAELAVVGLAAPAVRVLGPVVDEQEDPRGRQALDQGVEQRLGLAVDPVEVLEDQQQRLHLALAQQQPLDGVEGALAALRRVERLPRGILDRHVEKRQQGRQRRLQGVGRGRAACR